MDLETQLKNSLQRDHANPSSALGVDALMQAGRGAVRRRRLAAMSLTAVVVAGSAGVWQVAVGSDGGTPDRAGTSTVRTGPAGAPEGADPSAPNQVEAPDPGWPAALTPDGKLKLPPGMRVVDRIDDPVPNADHSIALELKSDTEHLFFLAEIQDDGGSSSSTEAGEFYQNLKPWVDDVVANDGDGPDSSAGFAFRDGKLVATQPGNRVLEQVDGPDTGADAVKYAVAAEVSIEGERWFVFAENHQGDIMTWTRMEPTLFTPDRRTLDNAIQRLRDLNNAEAKAEEGDDAGGQGAGDR